MSTLAVLAHFDPDGQCAPHVLRWARQLSEVADRLVVVSTARLAGGARSALEEVGEVVERENRGYDFCSWQHGLRGVPDWRSYDRLVLANDSVVGSLRPLPDVLGAVHEGPVWRGVVQSREHLPHLQSWLTAYGPATLADPVFAAFWAGVSPVARRAEVILRYELGLGRLAAAGGYALDADFEPDLADRARLLRRRARVAAGRAAGGKGDPRELFRRTLTAEVNPMVWHWEAARDGRLPFVKLEALRDDPARFGRRRMLETLTRWHPGAMAGVAEYLERTSVAYKELRAAERRLERRTA